MVNLARYDKRGYSPGAGMARRIAWYAVNAMLFDSWLWPVTTFKCGILRLFGATVGKGVVIKPRVNIKHPWLLVIGDHVWIGEGVWMDNLAKITLGSHVCLSQETYLLTGNHDYKDPAFGLIVKEITVEDGAWIGARAIVCPGVTVATQTVLTAGSVLQKSTTAKGIYQGNPAVFIRERKIAG